MLIGLLSQETTDFDGTYYRLTAARCEPKGPQRLHPPICIGGGGERRTLRTAAMYAQHWNNVAGTPEQFAHKRDVLHAHCEDVGRDPGEITCRVTCGCDPSSKWARWSTRSPRCATSGSISRSSTCCRRSGLPCSPTAVADLPVGDMRRNHPRFKDDAFDANLGSVETVRAIAAGHGSTAGQVALAWLLAKGPDVVPIPGTKRIRYLEENFGAVDVELTADEVARLTVVGDRTADLTWINRSTPTRAG